MSQDKLNFSFLYKFSSCKIGGTDILYVYWTAALVSVLGSIYLGNVRLLITSKCITEDVVVNSSFLTSCEDLIQELIQFLCWMIRVVTDVAFKPFLGSNILLESALSLKIHILKSQITAYERIAKFL